MLTHELLIEIHVPVGDFGELVLGVRTPPRTFLMRWCVTKVIREGVEIVDDKKHVPFPLSLNCFVPSPVHELGRYAALGSDCRDDR
jgi:hypothetical protein